MRTLLVLLLLAGTARAGDAIIGLGDSNLEVSRADVATHATADHTAVELTLTIETADKAALDRWIIITLPHDARVGALAVSIGGVRTAAEALDNREADRRYSAIVHHHQDPALIEEAGADRVRLHVYPVARGKPATITIGMTLPDASRVAFRPGSQWVHATYTADDTLVPQLDEAPAVDARTSLFAGPE